MRKFANTQHVYQFGMEDDDQDVQLDTLLADDLEAQATNTAALERLDVIKASLEAGTCGDLNAIAAELGLQSGLNKSMESFYMGDAPKKTMTIALEEVDVIKVGLIAAGIAVLATIMKKIWDWISGGNSGGNGGGGGGGGNAGSKIADDTDKHLEQMKKDLIKMHQQTMVLNKAASENLDNLFREELARGTERARREIPNQAEILEKQSKALMEKWGNVPATTTETVKVGDVELKVKVVVPTKEDLYKERIEKVSADLRRTKTAIPTRTRLNVQELSIIVKGKEKVLNDTVDHYRKSVLAVYELCTGYGNEIRKRLRETVTTAIGVQGGDEHEVVKKQWTEVFDMIDPLIAAFDKAKQDITAGDEAYGELMVTEDIQNLTQQEIFAGVENFSNKLHWISTVVVGSYRKRITETIGYFTEALQDIEVRLKNAKNLGLSAEEMQGLNALKQKLSSVSAGFHQTVNVMRKIIVMIRRGVRIIRNLAEFMFESVKAVIGELGIDQGKLSDLETLVGLYNDINHAGSRITMQEDWGKGANRLKRHANNFTKVAYNV